MTPTSPDADGQSRLDSAVERSRVVAAGRAVESTLARWATGSRVVSWFLAEPDPEVVVVDLRETYTVGPVLRALAWAGRHLGRLLDRTGATGVADRLAGRVRAAPLRAAGFVVSVCALAGAVVAFAVGDRLGGWLLALGVGVLATRERRSVSELAETRVGRVLVAALEPPEPPDDE